MAKETQEKLGGPLVMCSILGHISGVLVAMALQMVATEEAGSLIGLVVGIGLFFIIGLPQILLMWIVVALPAAAIAFHFQVHQKTGLLAIVGTVLGIVAIHLPLAWGTGLAGVSQSSLILGGMNGGLSAVGFSLLARVWLVRRSKNLPGE